MVCKLSLTEIKHIFEEDATMLQISEIVKKTEEMFDLFNEHFYDNELTRPHGGKARRIKLFQARQKNSPPNRKAHVV